MALFDFAFLKRSISDLGAQLQAVRSGIEALLREREDIANAPAARSDVKQLFQEQFDRWQEDYKTRLQQHLDPIKRNLTSFVGPDQADNAARYLSVSALHPGLGQAPTTRSMDAAICALLGTLMKPAFDAVIDSLPWEGEGLPLAERTAKLREIDKRLDKLKRDEQELVQAAAAAGLTLTADAQATVGDKRRARV